MLDLNLGILRYSLRIFLLLIFPIVLFANDLNFSLHKLNGKDINRTILIFAGIQGDEPGGFNAASLLIRKYKILKGNVWVVPNLNFKSIIARSRGIYGDMNRKFSYIKKTDPDYKTIEKVKNLILDKNVNLILNLHDGSGFYRKKYINGLKNPNRWGQSHIIDQAYLFDKNGKEILFGDLKKIANTVIKNINKKLIDREHFISLKNTNTAKGNKDMSKTLTYFAILNKKPAFGIEASKNFNVHHRAYYHISAIEEYMKLMGIEFMRDFSLSPDGIKKSIDYDIKLAIDGKIGLDITKVRRTLNYFPIKKDKTLELKSSNPLLALVKSKKNNYELYYGNRRMTILNPQYFNYDNTLNEIKINVDGLDKNVSFGSIINVKNNFLIKPIEGYRVNIIGFSQKNILDESNERIVLNKILKRFSVDKYGRKFRVEVYNRINNKFAGMLLMNFVKKNEFLNSKQIYSSFLFLQEL